MTDEELQEMIDEADRDGIILPCDCCSCHQKLVRCFILSDITCNCAPPFSPGDGEINEEEFYKIMKKTSLF